MPVNPDGFFTTSNPTIDKVVITSTNSTTARVMTGAAVGGLNGQTGESSLPQLTAQAFLKGIPVAGVSFRWSSSNPDVCAVDQSGNCTRVRNTQCLSFDSNGAANLSVQAGESFLGGLAQIKAVALRPDGSESGVYGTLNIAVQDAAPRQGVTRQGVSASSASPQGTPNYYSAVAASQPPAEES